MIASLTANQVSLDRFILSYDPVLQSKGVAQIKLPSSTSDLIDDSVVNISTFPKFEQIAAKTGAVWSESGVYLANASNIIIYQYNTFYFKVIVKSWYYAGDFRRANLNNP